MPRLIVTEGATLGLERCRKFLVERNPDAAERAGRVIAQRLGLLEINPWIGRPFGTNPALRELVIGFGKSGYVALYRYDDTADEVMVLAFQHQREAGY